MVNIYGAGRAFDLKYQRTPLKFTQHSMSRSGSIFQRPGRLPESAPQAFGMPKRGMGFLPLIIAALTALPLIGKLFGRKSAPQQPQIQTQTITNTVTVTETKTLKETETITETKTVTVPENTKPDEDPQGKPEFDVDGHDGEVQSTAVKIVAKKTGDYFLSHAYVNEDGSDLTAGEYKQIQNYLRQNPVGFNDDNGDGRNNTTNDSVILPNQITIGGKTYVLGKNPRDRIIATQGGKVPSHDRDYNAGSVTRTDGEWWVKDKKTGEKVDDKIYKTKEEAQQAANKLGGEAVEG